MKFMDDKCKKLSWFNRNYLYLGTVLFICLFILVYIIFGSDYFDNIGLEHIWYDTLKFDNLIRVFLNGICHLNWQHALLNSLTFLGCGLYIERKTGTIPFILLNVAMLIISGVSCSAASLSLNFVGASGIVYMSYAYIIIDYLFSFHKYKRNKTNVIFGAIIITLIYFSMCYCGGTEKFAFVWYPYNIMNNAGHYYAFTVSAAIFFVVNILELQTLKTVVEVDDTPFNFKKRTYIIPALLIVSLITATTSLFVFANGRREVTIIVDANIDELDAEIKFDINDIVVHDSMLFNEYLNTLSNEVRNKYYYRVYEDKEGNHPYDFSYIGLSNGHFLHLAHAQDRKYYLELYEGYNVYIYNLIDIYGFEELESIENENKEYRDLNLSLFDTWDHILFVEKNGTFRIKTPEINADHISVYANGELVNTVDGYYVIENVNEDITLTYSWK